MIHLLSLLTSAIAVMAVPLIAETRSDSTDPQSIYVKSSSYGGTGCPPGSVGVTLSSDATSLTFSFGKAFSATTERSISERRRACNIALNLYLPNGYTYAIANFTIRGYVSLDAGVTAFQRNTFYFSGSSQDVFGQSDFKGPINKAYAELDTFGLESLVFAPCGSGGSGVLNVLTQAEVMKPQSVKGNGIIEEDALAGAIEVQTRILIKKCPSP